MRQAEAHKWMLLAVVAGIAARVAFGAIYWVGKPLTHDEREYLALASSVADGRGFTYDGTSLSQSSQQFGRAPGYPAFLAAIGASNEPYATSPLRVKIAQSVLGGLAVWLIGQTALTTAGPLAGVVAASIAAIYLPLVWIPAYVLSEALYSVVALLAAYLLHVAATSDRNTQRWLRWGIAAGIVTGAGILVRPALLLFLPLACTWLVWTRRLMLSVVFIAAAAAVVAPWTTRNAGVYGRFVLVATEGGVTFWTGNHSLATGDGDLATNAELKEAEVAFRARHAGVRSEQLEALYYRDALESIAANPGRWFLLMLKKLFYTVVPIGPSYSVHSPRYRWASAGSYLLLLPFAAAGFARLWRSGDRPTSLWLLGASAVLVNLLFFPQERFRLPVIDPILIVCAAPALAFIIVRPGRPAMPTPLPPAVRPAGGRR